MGLIFALETSCDDTAAAIVDSTGSILADMCYSQQEEHAAYGGVVPEIGSRSHIAQINYITRKAFNTANKYPEDMCAIAATFAPGLIGPLLVGANFAKGLSLACSRSLIAIHHIEGHILSGWGEPNFPKPPFLCLIVSGGHSAIYVCEKNFTMKTLGQTLDDAAGEAFDKIGRFLGLGYPAGKIIDQRARLGDPKSYAMPIAMREKTHMNFSFSGLKTHGLNLLREKSSWHTQEINNFLASFQEAICQALIQKIILATQNTGLKKIVLGGGVAANSRLRELISQECHKHKLDYFLPPKNLCTDNAVMIARAAQIKYQQKKFSNLTTDVRATLGLEEKIKLNII